MNDDIVDLEIKLSELQKEVHDIWFILILIVIIVLALLATWVISVVIGV